MIRIHTFGGLTVRADDGTPLAGAAAQPRRMAILALLARAGERGITREKLLTLLWPDADDERGPRTLAQAIYALRKDLGAEEAITGSKELRLDPALVSSDVAEFAGAAARGDDERAAALYCGPFLDGFRLPGADKFGRWLETERTTLAHDYARILESLARAAQTHGAAENAVAWWRKLAALEPLNARVTVGLMGALAAGGDRAGAVRHAHIYELLVQEELDLPPDKEVIALAQRLRAEATATDKSSRTLPQAPEPRPSIVVAPTSATPTADSRAQPLVGETADSARRPRRSLRRVVLWAMPAVGVTAFAALFVISRHNPTLTQMPTMPATTVVSVGRIVSYGSDSSTIALGSVVSDLLATGLARVANLQLVSQSRILELMRPADTSAAAHIDAARRAGATDVIDGVLYARPGGMLRLDLRRIELATGAIRDARTVEGSDLFALVDSGTAQLSRGLGVGAPRGSVSDVTTHSVTAYRMYAQGMRAYYNGDNQAALSLFDGALAEDSLFALAAYYGALTTAQAEPGSWPARLERAKRLAAHAADRDRLAITADWAFRTYSPSLRALADTLAGRYPTEVEGYLYRGISLINDGEFLAATTPLRRVIELDSLALLGSAATCRACQAVGWLVDAYLLADSADAAEREARRWLRMQSGSWAATQLLLGVLEAAGRLTDADSLLRATTPPDASYEVVFAHRLALLLRAHNYIEAERLLREEQRRAGRRQQADVYWWTAYTSREQGRLAEALAAARTLRNFPDAGRPRGRVQSNSVLEAQILLERGETRRAAALFDSVAHLHAPTMSPSEAAKQRAWVLTQAANAYALARDTINLARTAESVFIAGQASGFARDRRLHHHARALLALARGREGEAIADFQAAVYSLTAYTRTNYELARVYLRERRARDAVRVLQPAFRGSLDGSNLYVSRTELRELLAQAWDASGVRDSAAAHYAAVANAWLAADAPLRARGDAARTRATQLRSH